MTDLITRLKEGEGTDREAAFKSRFTINADGCWIWSGAKVPGSRPGSDRGAFCFNGKNMLAHRASYEMYIGPIPTGLFVCHRCDVPSCVNPAHLFVGTHMDNMMDMVAKGRAFAQRDRDGASRAGTKGGLRNNWSQGENNARAKITREDAVAIREKLKSGVSKYRLARIYAISERTIGRIRDREIWNGE